MKISLFALLLISSVPVHAHEFQPGYSRSQICSKTIYKEQYIPGTLENPGYVKSWKESVEVPCQKHAHLHHHHSQPNQSYSISNSNNQNLRCNSARTTAGGLVGGGLAAALSKKNSYGWTIPLGAVLGMGVANSEC